MPVLALQMEDKPFETPAQPSAQAAGGAGGEGCTADALEVIRLLNEYRAENGLPSIPASTSLCTVGATHVADSISMSQAMGSQCNLHSWKDCCYTSDHANSACMWDKPAELTCYTGRGYENSAGGGGSMSPEQALDGWKVSAAHNEVMLNSGPWANLEWNAVGVGIGGGYAHLWFGEEADDC